jgi:hypothetical protein
VTMEFAAGVSSRSGHGPEEREPHEPRPGRFVFEIVRLSTVGHAPCVSGAMPSGARGQWMGQLPSSGGRPTGATHVANAQAHC